jgi:hypothetical protein
MGGSAEDIILVEQAALVSDRRIALHMSHRMRQYLLADNATSKLEVYRIDDFQNPRNSNNVLVQVGTTENQEVSYLHRAALYNTILHSYD